MKKITVVGGGNAGCFTALYCAWMDKQKDFEVELIYDPEIPPERVGQATILEASALLWAATGFNWYDNKIHATMKRIRKCSYNEFGRNIHTYTHIHIHTHIDIHG